ncbi:hypothetical protein INR49_002459 [Caranx melampygus]|nr:hypothetical protein INR49_002459 [Caranx melampygus]
MNQSGGSALLGSSLGMDLGHPIGSQFSSSSPVTIDVPLGDMSQGLLGSNQLTTIDHSELSAQLGLGLGGGNILQRPQSPEHPLSATASPTSSLQDDDMDDFRRVKRPGRVPGLAGRLSRSHLPGSLSVRVAAVCPDLQRLSCRRPERRCRGRRRRRRRRREEGEEEERPNEPQKPVSAYALFFRDTQAAIKGQNPNATFGEVSKIVASMWDSLGEEQKQVYKRKNEAAKKDYLKALAEYRAGQNSQVSSCHLHLLPLKSWTPLRRRLHLPPRLLQSQPHLPLRPGRPGHQVPALQPGGEHHHQHLHLQHHPGPAQVTTRSRTGASKQQQNPPAAPNPPTVTKIIIKQTQLPSGGVSVTATPASSPRQPPPLQQMQSTPPPPRLQQMVHAQAPPPLQAKPRGGGAAAATAPPPLQIKVVPSSRQSDSSTPILVTSAGETPASGSSSSALTVEVGQSAAVVAGGEEVAEAEDGMEVEVNVTPGPSVTPTSSPNICVRAGCTNPAVESKDWDKEYCSNECVATHCRCVYCICVPRRYR